MKLSWASGAGCSALAGFSTPAHRARECLPAPPASARLVISLPWLLIQALPRVSKSALRSILPLWQADEQVGPRLAHDAAVIDVLDSFFTVRGRLLRGAFLEKEEHRVTFPAGRSRCAHLAGW